ncbi:hypothetical protein GCM10007857_37810 [Bradyrhizobium iriomotense]|uniref:Uncharacterized protein n=1 Tax=Bradyrhizobium iriomotense TaxID=441950 RepID=A0ABQ6B2H5_9BRAD|nr:hypothetical protein GCM10007857_37810 [Bradyrhizobium iriomotense]
MVTALKRKAGSLSDLERELRRDQSVGAASNPVGPEIFAAHMSPPRGNQDSPIQLPDALHGSAIPDFARRSYNAITANLASKNMMNHYGTRLSERSGNPLLTLELSPNKPEAMELTG